MSSRGLLDFHPRWLDAHVYDLERIAKECLREKNKLPALATEISQTIPGFLRLTIVSETWDQATLFDFILTTIKYHLIAGKTFFPLKMNQCILNQKDFINKKIYVCEILIEIDSHHEKEYILNQLPKTIKLLESGLCNPHSIYYLCKTIATLSKDAPEIYSHGIKILSKWKGVTWQEFFSEASRLIPIFGDFFLKHRHQSHLLKIIFSSILLKQKEFINYKNSRVVSRVFISKVSYHYGVKQVLSVCVRIKNTGPYDLFQERHILQAFQSITPGIEVKIVEKSSISYSTHPENTGFFYLEIEKNGSIFFNSKELFDIKTSLTKALDDFIEPVTPRLVMVRNQEEIMKNLSNLKHEINDKNDPTQVIVSFESHSITHLAFNILIASPHPQTERSIKELINKSSNGWNIDLEQENTVRESSGVKIWSGILNFRIPKSSDLTRKDGSSNLYRAHHKVISFLKNCLGNIREYTGGIIIQQNALFESLIQKFSSNDDFYREVIEDYIYHLTPIETQHMYSIEILAKSIEQLIIVCHNTKEINDKYIAKIDTIEDTVLVTICLPDKGIAGSFLNGLKEISPLIFNYSKVEHYQQVFLSLLLSPRSQDYSNKFLTKLKHYITEFSKNDDRFQNLRFTMGIFPDTLDPRASLTIPSVMCLRFLFEGLMTLDNDGKPICGLAEYYDVSDDRLVYTFHLREAFWSDGQQITVHDFAYTWKQILLSHSFSHYFLFIKNAKHIIKKEKSIEDLGVEVIDDKTLNITLEYPISYFLDLLTLTIFSPIHSQLDQVSPDWYHRTKGEYVCNGPFTLHDMQSGKSLVFRKNPNYWDKNNISLEQIEIHICSEKSSLDLFSKNKIDWVGNHVSAHFLDYKNLNNDSVLCKVKDSVTTTAFLGVNTSFSILSNRKFRQAISFAIDRCILSKKINSMCVPAKSFAEFGLINVNDLPLNRDVAKSKQLLSEALYETGLSLSDIPRLSLLFALELYDMHKPFVEEIQKELYEVLNIEISLNPLPWNLALPKYLRNDYHLFPRDSLEKVVIRDGVITYFEMNKNYDSTALFSEEYLQAKEQVFQLHQTQTPTKKLKGAKKMGKKTE